MKKVNKLWQKDSALDEQIERFTIGQDRELDMHLAEFDVLGSLAHIEMLKTINLLSAAELKQLRAGLLDIHNEIKLEQFNIEAGVEDVHSQVELLLTQRLGEVGKKIHSGRSRNDQVLLDIRLFLRSYIKSLTDDIHKLFTQLINLSERYQSHLLPGYTHMQVAMPSSFGLWFGAFAESLVDDVIQLQAAYRIVNKNPLGSAAGFGSSFPLDRKQTTELLGFESLNVNSVYAQMGRGKTERVVSQALSSVAETVGRMVDDIILYMSQNFAFISFPNSLTTGSSIMPHKKNPDLFEIIRARCNQVKALPNEIMLLTTNLNSGYQRDMQIVKERFIPALFNIRDCVNMLHLALSQIQVKRNIIKDTRYQFLFTVEAVSQKVMQGKPFREAYREVADRVEQGNFKRPEQVAYTHLGSLHNLGNPKIIEMMDQALASFHFEDMQQALKKLIML